MEKSANFEIQELERLAVLEASALLDSPAEEAFDRFTKLATTILDTPVALVSLVDRDRQFFKSAVGLPEPWVHRRQTPLSHSFCKHVAHSSQPLSVSDARLHPQLRHNLAIEELGVIAYLGIPLTTAKGHTLGSFCVIDSKPRNWNSQDQEVLQELAALVVEKIELRLLAQHLHRDYSRLRGLQLYREEMMQMLIHDLRTPLCALISSLELLQTNELPQSLRSCLEISSMGGEQLLEMVNSILEIDRLRSQQLPLQYCQVLLVQWLEKIRAQMSPLANRSGIELYYDPQPVPPLWMDAKKLERVIVNLVSNAIQHTPSGGKVCIQAQRLEEELKISVIDNGRGIPAYAFELIFEKFGRLPNHASSTQTSLGLGLAFSRQVVEAHGGEIWVESELGKGAQFHLKLPFQPPAGARSAEERSTQIG